MSAPAIGRYQLARKLANGGMGEVFLAHALGAAGFRVEVVLKRLFSHLAEHPDAVRMFQDEAHVLASLNHPNIPQVYDLAYSEGHWYLAIEFVPGQTLADVCRAGSRASRPIPLDTTASLLIQLCDALHHAHERCDGTGQPLRIVHRDVTPQNVMVTPDGFAKLLDFGVARIASRADTQGGGLKGTLAYMSPEQVKGQRLDKRSDVFSLGVILYELTTGRRLFRGSDVELMTQIVERDVPAPSSWLPHYPPELERIVMTALARDRSRRWPSAAHLGRALEELTAQLGIGSTHRSVARYYDSLFGNRERRVPSSGHHSPITAKVRTAQAPAPTPVTGTQPPVSAASGTRPPVSGTRPPVTGTRPPGTLPPAPPPPARPASGRQRPVGLNEVQSLRQVPADHSAPVSQGPSAVRLPTQPPLGDPDDAPLMLGTPKRRGRT